MIEIKYSQSENTKCYNRRKMAVTACVLVIDK